MNGGFSGNISDLRYFNSALGTAEIQSIVDSGPNLTLVGSEATGNQPKYLSLRWFFMDKQSGL